MLLPNKGVNSLKHFDNELTQLLITGNEQREGPAQACPLGSFTRNLKIYTPQGGGWGKGLDSGGEGHMPRKLGGISKGACCPSQLGTEVTGRNARGLLLGKLGYHLPH